MARLTGEHLCHLAETFDYDFYIEVAPDGGFVIDLLYGATWEEDQWLKDNDWMPVNGNMKYIKF